MSLGVGVASFLFDRIGLKLSKQCTVRSTCMYLLLSWHVDITSRWRPHTLIELPDYFGFKYSYLMKCCQCSHIGEMNIYMKCQLPHTSSYLSDVLQMWSNAGSYVRG